MLAKISQIEMGGTPPQKQPPPFMNQNQMIYKDNKKNIQKQTSKDKERPESVAGGANAMMVKGNANPYKHHIDN